MKKWILSPLTAAFFLIGCNRVEDHVQPVDLTNKVDKPKLVVFFYCGSGYAIYTGKI